MRCIESNEEKINIADILSGATAVFYRRTVRYTYQ